MRAEAAAKIKSGEGDPGYWHGEMNGISRVINAIRLAQDPCPRALREIKRDV